MIGAENELIQARAWVDRASHVLEQLLRDKYEEDLRCGREPNEDLYSNPFCVSLLDIPRHLLDGARATWWPIIRRPEKGRMLVTKHCFLHIGRIIIDPTVGQFVDLDRIIEQYPDMFVGRILVADIEEIEDRIGLRYRIKKIR